MLYGLFTNMRIALIIFPIHASHGCILQTYALYRTLRKLGHDVSIIDRQWDKLSLKNQLVYAVKSLIISIKRKCIRPLTIEGTRKIIMSELQTFVDKHLSNRKIYFRTPRYEELPHYDAFIVGSDQTWRPKYVSDILYYYLCFVPAEEKVKRIAYAPSFGTEEWEYSEQQTLQCRELVSRFDAIAVREDSGAKLCGKYLGINVEHVLDPTMLLNKEDYLSETGIMPSEQNRLSYYLLDNSKSKMQIVEEICKELHLTVQRINTETENHKAGIKERVAPSIEKWIEGFVNSKFIVADSFHATVFAIIFNKHFITIANKDRGIARFEYLLKMFGLENRLITDIRQVTPELVHESIDWGKVNQTMWAKQSSSLDYLKFNLGNI